MDKQLAMLVTRACCSVGLRFMASVVALAIHLVFSNQSEHVIKLLVQFLATRKGVVVSAVNLM